MTLMPVSSHLIFEHAVHPCCRVSSAVTVERTASLEDEEIHLVHSAFLYEPEVSQKQHVPSPPLTVCSPSPWPQPEDFQSESFKNSFYFLQVCYLIFGQVLPLVSLGLDAKQGPSQQCLARSQISSKNRKYQCRLLLIILFYLNIYLEDYKQLFNNICTSQIAYRDSSHIDSCWLCCVMSTRLLMK